MLKKLRNRFIIISLLSIFIVMLTILSIGNFILYKNMNDRTDNLLKILSDNGGYFPKKIKFDIDNNLKEKSGNRKDRVEVSPDAEFENRYFSIIFNDNGNIVSINMGFISSISEDDAIDMYEEAYEHMLEKDVLKGFDDNYKYLISNYKENNIIVFIDVTRDLEGLEVFMTISIITILLSMITVYIIVYFFSNIALKPMEESYKKQKQFITDASHEIKTPLAIIEANTDIIEMVNGESEWTKSNKNQVKRLTDLTSALVSLARMDEGDLIIDMLEFSLSDAILEEAEQYIAVANLKNKSLYLNIDKNIYLTGNEQYIRQMINIFVDNAIKYSDDKGEISISLKQKLIKKEIIIKNTVKDINIGNHDVLFERFYRMDTSRSSDTGGYGVGLSLAKSIVEVHKGSVTAFSKDRNTIEFKILL